MTLHTLPGGMPAPADPLLGTDIDTLAVSEGWKRKFHLIRKAGGPKQPHLKALAFGERFRILFNFPGFLFGPFYYLAKGMWKRALALTAACFAALLVLALGLDLAGLGKVADSLGYGVAAVFGVRANIDYYRKRVLGDNGWW